MRNVLAALSGGVIAAIIAAAVAVCIVAAAIVILCRKKARHPSVTSRQPAAPAAKAQPAPAAPAAKAQPAPAAEEKPSPAAEEKPSPAPEAPAETAAPSEIAYAASAAIAIGEGESEAAQLTELSEQEGADGTVLRGYDARRHAFVVVRFNKSFMARLIQSDGETKRIYSELKNELLSYGAKSRVSWKRETFRIGREPAVRIAVRGKTLCVYYALNAADYNETKYKVEDVSDVAANDGAACLYRIKNPRRARYAKDLVADVMARFGKEKQAREPHDYAADLPYETLDVLLSRKLVKELNFSEEVPVQPVHREHVTLQKVKVAEAHELMQDEEAKTYIEESVRFADKTKCAVVNIDTLDEYFSDGERADLETMKARIPYLSGKVTYIKVLARGTLGKKLTVEADDFSLDAVKMIVLTGGTVVKTRRN